MISWLHKLLNPHCPHCKADEEDNRVCQSCETLKMQLAIVNAEKQRMLEALLDKPKPNIEPQKVEIPQEVKPRMMTWNMRRQMLEAEDKKTAEIMRKIEEDRAKLKPAKTSNELEKELGVSNDEAIGRSNEEVIQPREHEEVKEVS